MESRVCPECSQGKHANCDDTAWDLDLDTRVTCECLEETHLRVWRHSRRGIVKGRHVRTSRDGEWVDILLAGDVEGARAEWFEGDVMTARLAFLVEVK